MPEAEEDVQFESDGGPLEIELLCGEAQPGTYSLRLVDSDGVTVLKQARGSFFDDIEDKFPLPGALPDYDEREIWCRARVWRLPPSERYAVTMTLKQGGVAVGQVHLGDKFADSTVIVELTLRLHAT